jgi:adenine-specific DNA-methyltransferase
MAKIEDLIKQISDIKLREEVAREVAALKSTKKFGLVFEEHIPEQVQLPGLPIRVNSRVVKRGNGKQIYQVVDIKGKNARIMPENEGEEETIKIDELVTVKRFGEPIYPTLTPRDRVERAPDRPWHTIINADNFHALELLLYCYEGIVDVIYIDPPYNTGARDWKYNNDYVDGNDQWRHSKWLAMMKRRLSLAFRLLSDTGILCVTIDDYEYANLHLLLEGFPSAIILGTAVINSKPQGRATARGFSVNHEYAIFVAKTGLAEVGRLPRTGSKALRYSEADVSGIYTWTNFRGTGANSNRIARPKLFYPVYVKGESIRIPPLQWNSTQKEWIALEKAESNEEVVYPLDSENQERVWTLGWERARKELDELKVQRSSRGTQIYRKYRPNQEGALPGTWWDDSSYSASESGTKILQKIFGGEGDFSYPKSLYAVLDSLRACGAGTNPNAIILDFFAGSGTTLHATALLNSDDGGNRKCILVTNNEVYEKTAHELNEQGVYPGNPEFEKYGICESVTWPRCKYAINGKRDDGTELLGKYLSGRGMKEGFDENIEYFRLDFLDPHEVAYGDKFEAILPILWLMSGAQGKRETGKGEKVWFIPKNSPFAVLIDENAFSQFKQAIAERTDLGYVFLVTDSLEAYRSMITQLPKGIRTRMLYKSYLDNFKMNIEQSV